MKYIFEELNKEGIETKLIILYDKKINPCHAFWACQSRKNCVYQDDFHDVFNQMMEAEWNDIRITSLYGKYIFIYAGSIRTSSSCFRYE